MRPTGTAAAGRLIAFTYVDIVNRSISSTSLPSISSTSVPIGNAAVAEIGQTAMWLVSSQRHTARSRSKRWASCPA